MPAKAPVTSIECTSLVHLHDELASVQDAISRTETEETWEAIARALSRFAALCNGNAAKYPSDLVAALRASSRPINSALISERTRLSGTATDFISAAVSALDRSFEPLLPQYFPTLLTVCTRANKVFVNRGKGCIHAVIEYTQSPAILHYLVEAVKDKSVSLRLAASEAVMLCLNTFNPPDLEKEARAKDIEAIIRATAVDANADVRKVSRKIFDAYKILLPGRVQSFTTPLTPTIRKYLDIKEGAVIRSQPPSRPASSQSTRSVNSDVVAPSHATSSRPHHPSNPTAATATTAVRPSAQVRAISTSSTTAARRPIRAPTPEVSAPPAPPQNPARRVREEPRRVAKLDMLPPDYIPTHSGPQRPLSATDLYFPQHPPLERVQSGPQRVALADTAASSSRTTNTVRSGPIRPVMMPMKSSSGDGAEMKERPTGGARRVLRLPDAEEAPQPTEGKPKTTSGPIRPRVISTSQSTPAVPQHAAVAAAKERDEALKAKKLASSHGAGSSAKGAVAAATAVAAARHARTASGGVQTTTASTRARAAEKVQEKEKEKAPAMLRKPSSRALPSSKAAVPPRPGAPGAASVTVREKPRAASGTKAGVPPSKPAAKDGKVVKSGVKSRAGTQEPPSRAQSVSPSEVPLPESPKAGAQVLPPDVPQEATGPAAEAEQPIVEVATTPEPERTSTPDEAEVRSSPATTPTPEEQQSEAPLIDFSSPPPAPASVPLPASNPESPSEKPVSPSPEVEASTPPPTEPEPLPTIPPSDNLQLPPPAQAIEARTPEQQRVQPHAMVAQTPISALVESIERGFFAMRGVPLSPMREEESEDESMLVADPQDADPDAAVFDDPAAAPGRRVVEPLFARRSRQPLQT